MIRLRRDDFEDSLELAKFAATANMTVADFRREFEYLIDTELPPIVLNAGLPNGGAEAPSRTFETR
jgi:hypothetical protein